MLTRLIIAMILSTNLMGAPAFAQHDALPKPTPCPTCWQPALQTSWQWQLSGTLDLTVDVAMYDVDLFETPQTTVATLHQQGRKVTCYLDAGSWEKFRPDAAKFPDSVKGKPLNGWPGERW